ncbi:hypothetical protein [Pseudofrankia sp. BMG5.37]|uniref:hypothetical protein n=1 Tax=Pseudofrankia sp. BMG5.37 TaxID=3050035 RepID=UPI0028942A93|nr:hypothetical protein [Pseudofrankia sp. BMG5.37]MDT3440978.1 hypothetical protein [Pseudofrankia sp. BMG5.37]
MASHPLPDGALAEFSALMQQLVAEHATSYTDLSRRITYSRQQISRAANGQEVPSEGLARALDDALSADQRLVGLRGRADRERHARRLGINLAGFTQTSDEQEEAGSTNRRAFVTVDPVSDALHEEKPTDRREFVALPALSALVPGQNLPTDRSPSIVSMSDDADNALRALSRADDAAPSEVIDLLWSGVRRLAHAYGDQLTFLVDDLVIARKAAFRLLDDATTPAKSRDLYFLAGIVCAMLAHTARDRGQPDTALSYQHSALLCADRSGHSGLRIFARTEQAATAYWTGHHTESARLARMATDEARSVRGSLSVLPAVQEARAWAAAGRADLATDAITRAADLRDSVTPDDLDDIGGILALPLPEQLGIVAGTAAWLPSAPDAERAARQAIHAFQTAAPHERSYNSEAIAHADLALACVRLGSLDEAASAVAPILDVPPTRRVHQIQTSVARVAHALTDARFEHSTTARDAVAAIHSFRDAG